MALQDQWGRRDKPFMRVAILGIAVALVGLLVYRQVDRWRGDVVTVWAAGKDFEAGARIGDGDLTPLQVREHELPEGTIRERRGIQGMQLRRAKKKGVAFFAGELVRPAPDPGPGLADLVPEGRVMMTLELPGLPVSEIAESLRFGDRFDLFSFGRGQGNSTGPIAVARDVSFLGWIQPRGPEENGDAAADSGGMLSSLTEAAAAASGGGGGGPSPFLLGVRPEDVNRLVWVQATRAPVTMIVHGRREVAKGELLQLPEPRSVEVEIITGARRQHQALRNP